MDKTKNKKINEDEEIDARLKSDGASVLSSDSSLCTESESSEYPDTEDHLRSSSNDLAASPRYIYNSRHSRQVAAQLVDELGLEGSSGDEMEVMIARFNEVVYAVLRDVANWRENSFRDSVSNELRLIKKNEKLRADQARLRAGPRETPKGKRQLGKSQIEHTSVENQDLKLVQQKLGASKQQFTVLEDIVLDAPLAASQTATVSSPQNAVPVAAPKPCSSEHYFRDRLKKELRLIKKNEKLRKDQARLRVGPRKAPQGNGQRHIEAKSAENEDLKLVQQALGASKQQFTVLEDIVLDAPLVATQTASVSSPQNATTFIAVPVAAPKPCSSEQANLRPVSEPGKSAPEKAKPPFKSNIGGAPANVSERRQRWTLGHLDPDVLLEVATAKARLSSPDTPPEVILEEAMTEIFDKGMTAKAIETQKRWWRQMHVEAEFILEVAIVKSWFPNKTAEIYIQEAITEQCTEIKPWWVRPVRARPRPGNFRPQQPWWSQELASLRKARKSARRRYDRYQKRRIRPPDAEAREAELYKEYKAANAIYRTKLRRAKELALET